MSNYNIDGVDVVFHRNGKLAHLTIDNLVYKWYESGLPAIIYSQHGDAFHGEVKSYRVSGKLEVHIYYVADDEVHDFLENPLSDEEKVLLVLKYGAPLLPRKDYERNKNVNFTLF